MCIRDRDYGFLCDTPLKITCVYNTQAEQRSKAPPISWLGGSIRKLQPSGQLHKEAVIHTAGIHYKLEPL